MTANDENPLFITDIALQLLKDIEKARHQFKTEEGSSLENKWNAIIQNASSEIIRSERSNRSSLLLPSLSTSFTQSKSNYHHTQFALARALFDNTTKLYMMVMVPILSRKDKQNHTLEEFYRPYLQIVDAYIQHLRERKIYLSRHTSVEETQGLSENIDKMRDLTALIWCEVSNNKTRKSKFNWIENLPTLPKFSEIIISEPKEMLLRNTQKTYTELETSLERRACELYIFAQEFTWKRREYLEQLHKEEKVYDQSVAPIKLQREEAKQQLKNLEIFIEALEKNKKEYPNDLDKAIKALFSTYNLNSNQKILEINHQLQALGLKTYTIEAFQTKQKKTP